MAGTPHNLSPRHSEISTIDDMPSNSSSGSQTTRLTPELGSDDSDLDLDNNELEDGIALQTRSHPTDGQDVEDMGLLGGAERHNRRRGSASTVMSFQLYTPDEERAVVRKFDRKLVLFVALLYMLSFLDRSNIGNARIAGLEEDLNLSSQQYSWILTAFYIAYIGFEWMSLLWKIIPAHIYVSIIVLSWGLTASLQSCVTSFTGLVILRFLLGIGEAGFAGIPYYLSFFFKREELALRTGFFISAAPLATSFASTLAWFIIKLGENGPIAPWRLLFLVEGFPSVLIAMIAWYVIPDGPGKAKYLSKREAKVARIRLRKQKSSLSGTSDKSGKSGLKWREVLRTLKDPKCYLTAFMFFCTNMAFASLPVFLPTIIRDNGHSTLAAQALSAPVYLLSFVIVILTAWFSDRLRNRSYFIICYSLLSASGYIILALARPLGLGLWWRYAAIYPAAIGFFSVVTIIITWNINNQESESAQGAGFAILQIIGQCGPLVGVRLFNDKDAPDYLMGMSICGGAMVTTACLAAGLRWYLIVQNRRRDTEFGDSGMHDEAREGLVDEKVGRPGERFRYML